MFRQPFLSDSLILMVSAVAATLSTILLGVPSKTFSQSSACINYYDASKAVLVGYGTAWKCGCADSACAPGHWRQLQAFMRPAPAGGGTGGATNGSGAAGQWGGTPNVHAIVIAPNGNDGNSCTVSAPCQSLEKARQAVRSSGTKIVYLRAGTYTRSRTLTLDANDSGETWMTYPGDPVNSAVLHGRNSVDVMIRIFGATNVTINGLAIQHFVRTGIQSQGGPTFGVPAANGNSVINSDIGFNTVTTWNSGCFYAEGAAPSTTLQNNYCHDTGSMGLSINTWFRADESIDGSVIANNVVLRTVQRMSDGGSIYVSMHGGFRGSNVKVMNNFIRDYGAPGVDGASAIYLDDSANHVTVAGNVVGPPTPGAANSSHGAMGIAIHNGDNNTVAGNIIDLGDSSKVLAAIWFMDGGCCGMGGSSFTNNTVISKFSGNQSTSFAGICNGKTYCQNGGSARDYNISNNTYKNYGGGALRTDGPVASDSAPIDQLPNLFGWTYTTPPSGGWGPPGFQIPRVGTPPSSPH